MTFNDTVVINPPIDTGSSGIFLDPLTTVGFILVVVGVLILVFVIRDRSTSRDIDPSLGHLMRAQYDPNKAALIMMLLSFPISFGVLYGLTYSFIEPYVGISIIVMCVTVPMLPYYIAKLQKREETRNHTKINGVIYTLAGEKIPFEFANCKFGKKAHLSDADREAILGSPQITETILDSLHPYECQIGKFTTVWLFDAPLAECLNPVEGIEFDYYGSYIVPLDTMILQEICKIQRVKTIEHEEVDEKDSYINEHMFVFWSMFDTFHAVKRRANLDLPNIGNNEVMSALTKSIGVNRKVIAGELTNVTEQLNLHQKAGLDFDDVVLAVGMSLYQDFKKNETTLTNVNLGELRSIQVGLGTFVLGLLLFAVIGYILGFAIGGG